MNNISVKIMWTKTGDTVPYRRQIDLSVEYPVTGDTTAIQDVLLQLPDQGSFVNSIRIKDELAEPPRDEIVVERINRLAGELAKKARAEKARVAEEQQKTLQRDRAIIEKWLASDDDLESLPGYVCYPDDMRDAIYDRNAQIRAAQDEAARVAEDARDKKEAERKARRVQRDCEIAEWANQYGSKRLCEQIDQGLDGWPLYLSERMAVDLPEGTELDNDGTDLALEVNPTDHQLSVARELATTVVALRLYQDLDDAFEAIEIRRIELDPEDGFDCDYDDPPEDRTHIYVIMSGYRPGSENFDTKSIRIRA